MFVIGFFRDVIKNFAGLITFITEPNKELSDLFGQSVSIANLLGIFLVGTISLFLVLHLFKLISPLS